MASEWPDPMDFEKLKKIDPGEWRQVHPQVYGAAFTAIQNDKRLRSGNELLLTGVEVDEAIEAAIEVAMVKIAEIKSEKCLKPYVARTAIYKARTCLRSKFAQSSTAFLTDSWEEKLEQMQKSGAKKTVPSKSNPFTDVDAPDYLLRLAELDVLFLELCTMLGQRDVDLIWMGIVEERQHKEIGEKYGWADKGVSLEIQRARARMKKKILGSSRAVAIVKELGLEDYLK